MRVEREFAEDYRMTRSQGSSEQPEYLGALLEDERRLVLVRMDPKEPWAAFRRMRTVMRGAKQQRASVDLFAAPTPLESEAKVIPLHRKRPAR